VKKYLILFFLLIAAIGGTWAYYAFSNDAATNLELGYAYYEGKRVPQSYRKAFSYYEKAAWQGNASAQYYLARMYDKGEGVEKNDVKAFEWYEKAAWQGNSSAQRYLGSMYYVGQGVQKDIVKAYAFSSVAAMSDQPLAVSCRDEMAKKMSKEKIYEAEELGKKLYAQIIANKKR